MATIQIWQEDGSLVKEMAGEVLADGRVQIKTTKGLGFLVCREAAEASKIDPVKAVFDKNLKTAHYQINQPLHGKLVKAWRSELNPAWVAYQAINEDEDGYNPHPHHLQVWY